MSVTLDRQDLFEEQGLEIQADSFGRDCIERSVPGLDGVVSVDLGGRGRKIRQNGVLRARSRLQMGERVAAISSFMDGAAHLLVTKGGEQFDNLRMDSFKVTEERVSGGGVVVDYEIIYTQLV